MEAREGRMEPGVSIEMSEKQKLARKRRNIAIGLCLFGFVAIFYVATIAKLGPRVMDRPIIGVERN